MRRAPTDGEVLGWHVLRTARSARNSDGSIDSAGSSDFYCVPLRLGIELDGAPHLTEDGKRYDEMRTRKLEALNVRIERFEDNAVLGSPEKFVARVKALIGERRQEISKQRSRVIEVRR